MSLPSLGSAAESSEMALAESYFGGRGLAMARGMRTKVSEEVSSVARFSLLEFEYREQADQSVFSNACSRRVVFRFGHDHGSAGGRECS
jgi:hypothetical protein